MDFPSRRVVQLLRCRCCGLLLLLFLLSSSWNVAAAWIGSGFASRTTPSTTRHHRRSSHHPLVLVLPQNKLLLPHHKLKANNDININNNSYATSNNVIFTPIFDFTQPETIDQVDRLDDAIMGGISTSSVQWVANSDHPDGADESAASGYARWSGVCRTDGGGFCGWRTNPFVEPLQVKDDGNGAGLYVQCRLTSDQEPERRVWKISTRTKPGDRGELLYQAPFPFTSNQQPNVNGDWTTVQVPFDTFRYVRGPRIVPDGPSFDASNGLYQIGMTMSKFAFGVNTTELENFRDGFFELQIKEIGVYNNVNQAVASTDAVQSDAVAVPPKVLTKIQTKQQRPLLLKLLFPLIRMLFFSEQSQRRKSTMRLLREKRQLSRLEAIRWGFRSRAASVGVLPSLAKTIYILLADAVRATLGMAVRIVLVYPIRLLNRGLDMVRGKKKLPSMTE